MKHAEKVQLRSQIIDRLRTELVGPNRPDETLDERPTQRYLTGVLWPYGTLVEEEDDEDLGAGAEGEESGVMERIAPLSQAMKPSSIGLSFVVAPDCQHVHVTASWGAYAHDGEAVKGQPEHWKRLPVADNWKLKLLPADGKRHTLPASVDSKVQVEWLSRPMKGGGIAVSLFLVNRKLVPKKSAKDSYCLFQPELVVTGSHPGERPFRVRSLEVDDLAYRPPDVEADELLYREQTVFAVGHGTAVNWEEVSDDQEKAGLLRTDTIPAYEVPQVIPPDWTGEGSLIMADLAEAKDGDAVAEMLRPLAAAYREWILQQEEKAQELTGAQARVAGRHLDDCYRSLSRIEMGLDLLESDPNVLKAFRFANQAMDRQRRQTLWARQARKENDWTSPLVLTSPPTWRPFQIAFILQALVGIVEPEHEDRQIADLLWFPTGGGKTEAYLGLAAFVMALRRLRGDLANMRGDAGVTVIMRYTLRLLTIQQFQRAATLICAAEVIRKQDAPTWGETPFRIGLYVGGGSTPNSFDECEEALKKAENQQRGSSPIQLVSCPWCGSPLVEKGTNLHTKTYTAHRPSRRLLIGCSRPGCDFHRAKSPEGVPAVVTDEEIYRLAPTLLIGTVDKFARLPWLGETQALFGRVKGEIHGWGFACEGDDKTTITWRDQVLKAQKKPHTLADQRPLLPPELIIQDELHLISGPLGTMVGLYESAIDQLCSREINGRWIGPKVIASTATIRRAYEQVKRLFDRNLAIFPSPGLTAADSFFAVQQPISELPGRVYVGLFAPGRSVKTALVRTYATLLSSPGAMKASDPKELDPYQTLVGYFNSLRELGGAVRLLEDDVKARSKVLASRTQGQKYSFTERVLKDKVPELTSRVDSRDIPEILNRLDRTFPGTAKEPPVDAVLASNMISVGVDVFRLGLMVVTGQPKTTAEYIQATSRVGREYPGLVVTVYNWARPRDLSHYERFRGYHAALYRYVEAISVTPFSSRARDRALAAVMVAMCRLQVKDLAPRENARRFKADDQVVQRLRGALLDRVGSVDEIERVGEVAKQLGDHITRWDEATAKDYLAYTGGFNFKVPRLLYQLGSPPRGATFAAPNSMRDVEPAIGIYLEQEED